MFYRSAELAVRRKLAVLFLAVLLALPALAARAQNELFGLSAAATATDRLLEPQLLAERLTTDGRVDVIVEFAPPSLPDGLPSFSAEADAATTAGVRQAQDRILGRALAAGAVEGVQSLDQAAQDDRLRLGRMTFSPMFALSADSALLAALAEDPEVVRIHINHLDAPALNGSLPLINMPAAHSFGARGSGQVVAVLDTGARVTHEHFSGRIATGACYSGAGQDSVSLCPGGVRSATTIASANDCTDWRYNGCGHGTHVSSVAAGSGPRSPRVGVAPAARLFPINVFSALPRAHADCTGLGLGQTHCVLSYLSDQINGLERVYARRGNYQIAAVNMSLGGGRHTTPCNNDARRPIIQMLTNAGITVVAAAGNNGYDNAVSAPACIPEAMAIGNTTTPFRIGDLGFRETRHSSSNWGSMVALAAPGETILAADVGGILNPNSNTHYSSRTGTSMAAPHVAGAIAAMRSVRPGSTPSELVRALFLTGLPIISAGSAAYRINVRAAIRRLPPVNNLFAFSTRIAGRVSLTGTNVWAYREPGQPTIATSNSTNAVWWTYRAGADSAVTVDTQYSDFDTTLAVFTGSAVNALTEVASNDDAIGLQSRVRFRAESGQAYHIAVAGFNNRIGNIRLNVGFTEGPSPSTSRVTVPPSGMFGQDLTLSAVVRSDFGSPAGSVSFRRDDTEFAQGTLDADGRAAINASDLPAGTHQITAHYLGSAEFQPSASAPRSLTIAPGAATATTLSGPAAGTVGQSLSFSATVTSDGGTPGGTVSFRRDGTEFATGTLNASGVATASGSFLVGSYQITARYPGGEGFAASTSAARPVAVEPAPGPPVGFVGGGAVFGLTQACEPSLGARPHAVTVRYRPAELNGRPSGVSIVWREGSEHLALWGPMGPSGQFFGAAGRATWTRFVFYPMRPLIRVVQRQITAPSGASLADAQEIALRVRVQNFGAIEGCSVTIAATLRR